MDRRLPPPHSISSTPVFLSSNSNLSESSSRTSITSQDVPNADASLFDSITAYPRQALEQRVHILDLLNDINTSSRATQETLMSFQKDTEPLLLAQLARLNDYTKRVKAVREGIYDVFVRLRKCRKEVIRKGWGIDGVEDPVELIEREANAEFEKRRQAKLREYYERLAREKMEKGGSLQSSEPAGESNRGSGLSEPNGAGEGGDNGAQQDMGAEVSTVSGGDVKDDAIAAPRANSVVETTGDGEEEVASVSSEDVRARDIINTDTP